MAGEMEYQYRTPDANASANPTGGSVVATIALTNGTFNRVDVTGFPASLVLQPGDLLWRTASGTYGLVTARVALNGSGAGSVYLVPATTATWTAADALEVRRPLPSAMASHFTAGGLIVPAHNTAFASATPTLDWYMQPTPEDGLNLYMAVSAKLRGTYNHAESRKLLLRNWADTSTIESFAWDTDFIDGYGGVFAADGTWYDFDVVFQVTDPAALTDWRYKAEFSHSTGGGTSVMYVRGVAVYWSDAPLGTFRWSYQGGSHKAWDWGNDLLFDGSEPLTYHRVRALEQDPAKPYVLGAECDLRDGSTRSTPRVVSVRRALEARSSDLPLPEIELNNRPPTLTRQLVAKGSL